jgi:hypothetical protein
VGKSFLLLDFTQMKKNFDDGIIDKILKEKNLLNPWLGILGRVEME